MPSSVDTLFELIRSSGLDLDAVQGNEPGPSVETAWRAMAGFDVEPIASLPLKGELSGVHQLWLDHARQAGVGGAYGSVPRTPGGTGRASVRG
ncbi:hypothetical protein ACFXPJ_31975, partial [Streptomyces goshikiensis]